MKLDPSTRVCFRYPVRSDKLDKTYLITTPHWKAISGQTELTEYLLVVQKEWCRVLNGQHDVDDFRLLTGAEAELYFTGRHPHSPEEMRYENTCIRH